MDLKFPMWAFQHMFRHSAHFGSAHLLGQLCDKPGFDLEPAVYLVGFRIADTENHLPVCVEPGDCPYQPEVFSETLAEMIQLYDAPQSIKVTHPTDWNRADYEQDRLLKCLRQATLQTIERLPDQSRFKSYCSKFAEVGNYFVGVVIQINRQRYEQWPRLKERLVPPYYKTTASLIDETISEYLKFCWVQLNLPDPGKNLLYPQRSSEILRAAAERFMYTPAQTGIQQAEISALFGACNTISALRYEGIEGTGELIIARPGHPAVQADIRFEEPVRIGDYRAVRKLLQLCSSGKSLLFDFQGVYGLGHVARYESEKEDLFVVRFIKHHTWEMLHDGKPLMRTTAGEPRLPVAFDQESVARNLESCSGVPSDVAQRLALLAERSSRAKHGTMLVISPDAGVEAERLQGQATRIQPRELTEELLGSVVTIDGAVLLDSRGICHAIGVILDGRATEKGNPARGARYNSAIRYVNEKKNCVVIVVSEDQTVDVIMERTLQDSSGSELEQE